MAHSGPDVRAGVRWPPAAEHPPVIVFDLSEAVPPEALKPFLPTSSSRYFPARLEGGRRAKRINLALSV